tara:strand:- start:41 stop:343 length:303 start_codon:yes stop_codon:yes gene_type:complete
MNRIIKWVKNVWRDLVWMEEKSKTIYPQNSNILIPKKEEILLLQGYVWELYENGIPVGYYKNPSRVAASREDLHRSKLYYHCNRYGTYEDEKYKLVCLKF